jgi:hypothetical protein
MSTRRLFPLSGVAFVALTLVAVLAVGGSTPSPDASAADVASFYRDDVVRQGVSAFLLAASVPFLAFFGIGLTRAIGSHEDGGRSGWGDVLLAGTILTAAGVLVAATAHFALVDGGNNGLSPDALQALNALDGNTWMAFNAALGVMMLGAAGALLEARTLRLLGWSALALGVLLFVPFADFFALLLTLVWIVVTGIAVAQDERRAVRGVAARPA